ncbi:hypothetical protein CQ14_24970 [Bradyrhizobium lablabi]|uniref:Uncharacterized protein n=1 Tax=Bradyrhizobium lablabi TaxID=722472 RepID=A0A0R3MJY7_9BRAD|nr:hypothetical protein [Bradyrhizobium lablabi]KRR18181.1 hypothetical protein CQ14_24970 [Bradyrhizobium lablabi]
MPFARLQDRHSGARIVLPGQNESTALPDLSRIVTQVAAKGRAHGGATPEASMSGHLRFCFAAFVFLASLSTSPASSNSFADFFNLAPRQATAPAPAEAEEECLSRPGKSTTAGQHWVYRFDGHRKCWFQTDEAVAAKQQARHRAAKPRAVSTEENEAARRKRKAVVDARAELLRSAPAETSPPTPPAPRLKVADAASVVAAGAAALVPPAPIANGVADQQPASRQVDVETLLTAAPAASAAVAISVPSAAPTAVTVAEAADDGWGSTASWIGMLLMALGLVSVLVSSRPLRETMLDLMRERLGTQWGRERPFEGGRMTSRQQADYFSA